MTSVGRARFKSLLAHISDCPRVPDPGLRPLRAADFSRRHPRCSVVAVAAASSSLSRSGVRLRHLSHVVCVGRSTRRSEVWGSSPNRRFRSRKRRAQGQGPTAERREPVGVVVGQADRGLTQRATLPPAIAEQWADQRQSAALIHRLPFPWRDRSGAVERCPAVGRWAPGRQLDRPHNRPPPTAEHCHTRAWIAVRKVLRDHRVAAWATL
jgi:hypothetical protein